MQPNQMTQRSTQHSSFEITRDFAAPVERVFRTWSEAEKKQRWFACHDEWRVVDDRFDFRVGGVDVHDVAEPNGVVHGYRGHYLDIVTDERIVYAYDMTVGEARISVSLVTVTFARTARGTRMTFTEQIVFLDGHGDCDERREGTELGLSRIDDLLGD